MNLKIETMVLQSLRAGPKDLQGIYDGIGLSVSCNRVAINAACRSLILKKKVSKNDTGWFLIIK